MTPRAEFLSRTYLFQGFPPEKLEEVAARLEERDAVAGETIVSEGETGDTMYFLMEGKVRVTRVLTLQTARGFADREKAFNILEAKHFSNFGEVSLISDCPRTATVTTVDPCHMLVLKRNDYDELCEQDLDFGYRVTRRVCEALCDMLKKSNDDVLRLATALSIALAPS